MPCVVVGLLGWTAGASPGASRPDARLASLVAAERSAVLELYAAESSVARARSHAGRVERRRLALEASLERERAHLAIVRGSLEYTEYFATGTEPVEVCPIHGPGAHPTLVSDGSTMPGAIRTLPAPVVVDGKAAPPTADQKSPEKKPEEKKRGFWGKIFGK